MTYRRHTSEFKAAAVRLVVEQGLSARQAASDLGIKPSTLMVWIRRHREVQGEPNVEGDLRQQVRQLQQEVDRLRMERDIPKKRRRTSRRSSAREVRLHP